MERNPEKIIVVEDNEKVARLISGKLTKVGYETYIAGSGLEALDSINRHYPDLIIMDIVMSDMDGFQVKQELAKDDLTKYIPLIFLSGKTELEDKIRGLNMGADDYLTKPFRTEELLARVEAILRRKRYYEFISMHDSLTGVYNIHFFEQQFALLFSIAQRYGNSFSLAVIDVNKFKQINDSYGHKVGDQVLKAIARVIQKNLRKSDILCRYGGDEFVILLPGDHKENLELLTRRFEELVRTEEIIVGNEVIRPSVSIGIVHYSEAYENKDLLFEEADRIMYKRKQEEAERRAAMTVDRV